MKTGKTLTVISVVLLAVVTLVLLGPFQPSGAILLSANLGSTQEIDVDGDGTKDLRVLVNSVSANKAELTVTKLRGAKIAVQAAPPAPEIGAPEETPAEVTLPEEVIQPPLAEKPIIPQTTLIIIIVAVAVVAIGMLFYNLKKRGSKQ
ncbi:TPA: hypothetical protein H1016_03245 [archaeon]|uniref:Uncharacterized protein n=1 Tax=Candidatus Naiadarchaeum limnaeum TaxID=2756139 RepID=A0A832V0B1_9ARCH|nr:hypothetical protein [Candidatus Naiadarchaeum limnaeum]